MSEAWSLEFVVRVLLCYDVFLRINVSFFSLGMVGRPACSCGAHVVATPDRLLMLSDAKRTGFEYLVCTHVTWPPSLLYRMLRNHLASLIASKPCNVFVSSDGGLLTTLALESLVRLHGLSICRQSKNTLSVVGCRTCVVA